MNVSRFDETFKLKKKKKFPKNKINCRNFTGWIFSMLRTMDGIQNSSMDG